MLETAIIDGMLALEIAAVVAATGKARTVGFQIKFVDRFFDSVQALLPHIVGGADTVANFCVALAFEVPQYHAGASFLMNQRTWALCMTMSDASGRPLWNQMPGAQSSLTFAGFPVHIVTWMPDVQPGAVPIAFGNWRETYMVVTRQATTMRPDAYSAGFCTLFRFEARVGGAVLCGNAARLLRIR